MSQRLASSPLRPGGVGKFLEEVEGVIEWEFQRAQRQDLAG